MDMLMYSEYQTDYNYTNHSIIRAKERAGLNKKKAAKMMEIAKTRGKRSEDCTWSVDRRFLDKKSTEVSVAVAFNGYCFIYERETMKCITMFRLPKNFGQKKTYYKADKRKYKYNFDYCEYDD